MPDNTSNQNTMAPTLTVYKASAGSGKTFTLAIEYIKLLLDNPKSFDSILAVTFTNKATEEMKMRILSQLYGLWKKLPSSDSYKEAIMKDTGMKEEYISSQAQRALRFLLHNYQFFRVQTIDTFFQAVLRNMARELQLNVNLRVGLNNQEVVEEAVDEIIDTLADDRKMLTTVRNYMDEKISEDKSWNVIDGIKKFGSTIFSEVYKQNRASMEEVFSQPGFFDAYRKKIRAILDDTTRKYVAIGRQFMEMIDANGLAIEDFSKGKSGVAGYFIKLANGLFADKAIFNATAQKAVDSSEAWVTKTNKRRDEILALVDERLRPLLQRTEEQRARDAFLFNSAKLTLTHLNDVELLHDIERTAHTLNDSAQRFMLSDTQSLLHEIIGDDDAPFVFEKIGTRLRHVMIDEFQDTSTVQWANFKTLLRECMSHGTGSLIVGDVKQSIYRFRSGDWRLLNDIDGEFRAEEIAFRPKTTNFRSKRNVIEFNNAFFEIFARQEVGLVSQYSKERALQLEKAYGDVKQEVPADRPVAGFVNVTMLPSAQVKEPYCMEEQTLQRINELLSRGVRQKDIAVLVRDGKGIRSIADYIEKNGKSETPVKVVSAEAFRLDASRAVRIIITALKVLSNPDDELSVAILASEYGSAIPEAFMEHREALLGMSLQQLAEELVRIFRVSELTAEGAYLTVFFDQLHQYCNDFTPLLGDFLDYWEDEACGVTIETGDVDGVRLLTIHKSKGLEFDNVIIPYCNWSLVSTGSTVWTRPTMAPFDELPLVPLHFRSVDTFKDSIYEAAGVEEYIQVIVDNLNLLYVAMTRAGIALFMIGERPKANKDGVVNPNNRSAQIVKTLKELPAYIKDIPVHLSGVDNEEEVLEVTYGTLAPLQSQDLDGSDNQESSPDPNVFSAPTSTVKVNVTSCETKTEFMQSNQSREFADDQLDEHDRYRLIRMGTVMHQVFSLIGTVDDVEPVLQRMEFDGTLYSEEITREVLIDTIREKFQNPQVQEWFSPRWTLYNECAILDKYGEQRPDRVMTDGSHTIVVDFKFGVPFDKHHRQVERYMKLLRLMGMPDVKGYLWYVSSNNIEEVKTK